MPEKDECVLGCDEEGRFSYVHKVEDELELTGRFEVVRRHFAMDVFDGILPVIAIIVAGLLAESSHDIPVVFEATLLASIGSGIAMFFAGFAAAYMTEEAEGKLVIEELEKKMNDKFSHQLIVTAERESAMIVSVLNGLIPLVTVLITISPMLVASIGWIGHVESFYLSIGTGFLLLFGLGIFLGVISKSNIWMFGLKTLAAGGLTVLALILISLLTGAVA